MSLLSSLFTCLFVWKRARSPLFRTKHRCHRPGSFKALRVIRARNPARSCRDDGTTCRAIRTEKDGPLEHNKTVHSLFHWLTTFPNYSILSIFTSPSIQLVTNVCFTFSRNSRPADRKQLVCFQCVWADRGRPKGNVESSVRAVNNKKANWEMRKITLHSCISF